MDPFRTQTQFVQSPVVALTWKQHLFAGGLSRGLATTTMFPVDVVKTRVCSLIRNICLWPAECSLTAWGAQLQANSTLRLRQALRPPYFAGYNAALASQIPYGVAPPYQMTLSAFFSRITANVEQEWLSSERTKT